MCPQGSDSANNTPFEHSPLPVSVDGKSYLQGFRALPTIPSIVFGLVSLLADPKSTDAELAEFIWKSPSLLSAAINMLNSRTAECSISADRLQQEIAQLGKNRLRILSFQTPLLSSLHPWKPGFYSAMYWERSLLCAEACKAVAQQLRMPCPEQYYITGLLHDIGYLVLLQKNPTSLADVFERWSTQRGDLLEIERALLGIDHCQLGVEIARKLKLETWIIHGIAQHHHPSPDSDSFGIITSIGSVFCNSKGIDFSPPHALPNFNKKQELEEIISGLLPGFSNMEIGSLINTMEDIVPGAQSWAGKLLLETSDYRNENRSIPSAPEHLLHITNRNI